MWLLQHPRDPVRRGTTHPRPADGRRHRPKVRVSAAALACAVRTDASAGHLTDIVTWEDEPVDSDRIEGPLKEAGGKVKEEWGDATDDASTEAEGHMDQAEGNLQNEWGETKDDVRDAVDDDR